MSVIVAGRSSAVATGHLDKLLAALPGKRTTVFTGISPNPRLSEINAAAAQGLSAAATAVIGLGGGSCRMVTGSNGQAGCHGRSRGV